MTLLTLYSLTTTSTTLFIEKLGIVNMSHFQLVSLETNLLIQVSNIIEKHIIKSVKNFKE